MDTGRIQAGKKKASVGFEPRMFRLKVRVPYCSAGAIKRGYEGVESAHPIPACACVIYIIT